MTATLERPTPEAPAAAPRPRNRKRVRPGTVALWVIAIGGFVYLFVPLVTIVVFTFNHPTGKFNTTWESFTWDNWLHPFSQKAFTDALWQSVKVAAVACTLATILGSLIALALARYRIRGGTVINLLIVLPLTTPEIVMGASLFTLFFNQGVERGFWTIVIAHTMFCLSFVALTVKARIRGSDWTLENAAMDLGSSPMRTFWKITMPIITPGIVAAFLLSIALSIAARIALPPQVHVLATIIMLVAIAIIVGATVAGNRRRT
jgi:spermidine/putrescine transport system permease protein